MSFLPTYCYVASIRSLVYSLIQPRYLPYNYPYLVSLVKDMIVSNLDHSFNTICYHTADFQNNLFQNVIMDFLSEHPNEEFFIDLYQKMRVKCRPNLLRILQRDLWNFCYHFRNLRQMIEDDGYNGDYTDMFKIQYQTNNEYIWNIIDRLPRKYITDFLLFYHDLPNLQRFLTSEEINEQLFERAILFPTDQKVEYQQVAHWIGKQVEFTKIGNYHFMFLVSLTLEDIHTAGKIYSKYKFELTREDLGVMGKHGSKQGFRFVFNRIKYANKIVNILFTANQACMRNQIEFVEWLIEYYPKYNIEISDLAIDKMIELRYFDCLKVVKNSIRKHHHNKICQFGNDNFLRWYFNNFDIKERPTEFLAGNIWEEMRIENTRNYYQKMFKTMWDQKLPIAEWIIKPQVMEFLVEKKRVPLF
jgi:hypothetical protein